MADKASPGIPQPALGSFPGHNFSFQLLGQSRAPGQGSLLPLQLLQLAHSPGAL